MPKAELYIGNLGRDVSRRDIETIFDKYGKVRRCDIKSKGLGSSYAFLEYEDERDAEDALRLENGKNVCGSSMVIEWAKSREEKIRESRKKNQNNRIERIRECFECGRKGHFARDCLEKDRPKRNSRSNRDRKERDHQRSRFRSISRSRSNSKRRNRSRS